VFFLRRMDAVRAGGVARRLGAAMGRVLHNGRLECYIGYLSGFSAMLSSAFRGGGLCMRFRS